MNYNVQTESTANGKDNIPYAEQPMGSKLGTVPSPTHGETDGSKTSRPKTRSSQPQDNAPDPDQANKSAGYIINGVEHVEGYQPVGETQSQAMENTEAPEEYWEPIDAEYACGNRAQELVAAYILNSLAPKAPDSTSSQERWRPGKHVKKIGSVIKWIRNRPGEYVPKLFESAALQNPEDEGLLEVINGVDDRIDITSTANDPWSGIVQLNIESGSGAQFVGTGFLVAPMTIISAAHCIYSHADGMATSITCSAGRNGSERPFGIRTSTNFEVPNGWAEHQIRAEDYGVIFLDEPFSEHQGSSPFLFEFSAMDDSQLLSNKLNIGGYPAGVPADGKDSTRQWFHARTPLSVTQNQVTYDHDTGGGQSGSPCWHYDPVTDSRVVPCIHTNGMPWANSATRITTEMEGLFEEWRAAGF